MTTRRSSTLGRSTAVTDHAAGMAAALVQSIHPEKVFDFSPA